MEAARDGETQLRLVIDTIPTTAWTALPDGSNEFANRRWHEYTGLRSEDTVGRGWQAVFHPDDINEHVEKWRASLASGQLFENEARLRRAADGEYRWFLIRGAPLRDERGNVVRWYGIATDIEDRKRAEQALQRSEAYLADAQRMSRTGSWAFDVASRRIIHSSEEHHRLFGFDPAVAMPTWDDWVQRIHPDDRGRTLDTVENKIREPADFTLDCRTVHPDGTIRHIHAVGHPVLSLTGDLVEVVGTSIDVTERKRAEEALRESEEALREAQAELAHVNRVATMGHLTASIAHEVSQPIAATMINVRAALRFLEMQPPDLEEVRQALDGIVTSVNQAGDVIGRIRALIRKAPSRKERLDINETIREVIVLTRSEASKNEILVQTQLAEALPLIDGDRVQLKQVILNLIVNAIEAMSGLDEGPQKLLICSGKAEAGGVLVSVRDSGPGLAPEAAEHLFDAFYTTKPGGMGLGLPICRSIIEAHGGRLWAAANAPRGAAFDFTVPVS